MKRKERMKGMSKMNESIKNYCKIKAEKWQDFASGKELEQKKKISDLFLSLQPGDVVYALTEKSDWHLAHLSEKKRYQPYLVLKKEEKNLWVIPAVYKKSQDAFVYQYDRENTSKTYAFQFSLNQPERIEQSRLLGWCFKLDEADWRTLKNELHICQIAKSRPEKRKLQLKVA
jgi:hypothetical protein